MTTYTTVVRYFQFYRLDSAVALALLKLAKEKKLSILSIRFFLVRSYKEYTRVASTFNSID